MERNEVPKLEIALLEKTVKPKKAKGKRAAASDKGKARANGDAVASSDDGAEPPRKKKKNETAGISKAAPKTPRGRGKKGKVAETDDFDEAMQGANHYDLDPRPDLDDVASEDIDLLQPAFQSSEWDGDHPEDDDEDTVFDRPIWEIRERERRKKRQSTGARGPPSRSAGPPESARKRKAAIASEVIELDSD